MAINRANKRYVGEKKSYNGGRFSRDIDCIWEWTSSGSSDGDADCDGAAK